MGRDLTGHVDAVLMVVSIHAPAWGATAFGINAFGLGSFMILYANVINFLE